MASCCKYFWLSAVFLFVVACSSPAEEPAVKREGKAYAIIDEAIAAHGGDRYARMAAQFTFRGTPFTVRQDAGLFTYKQVSVDSLGDTTIYVLDNAGFRKTVNGQPNDQWAEKEEAKYGETTNSVVYFALLPFGLQSEAVIAEYLDSVKIKGNPYHKIQVTFLEEGGGEDFEDVFLYWIHAKSHTMDYLAYEYHTNGGGMRFRDAYRVHTVNGIRWQDYINYKPKDASAGLHQLDSLFVAGVLERLSTIDLENIQVRLLPAS